MTACEAGRFTTRDMLNCNRNCLTPTQLSRIRSCFWRTSDAHREEQAPELRLVYGDNRTKIFVVAISFGAALAVVPAAAQTGYGVKKNAPPLGHCHGAAARGELSLDDSA